MARPLITIIIPVYNIEGYLPACLNSVVGQTYDNLEIIVINDGSTDGSQEVIDRYAAKDERFVTLRQENAGLIKVRERGMEMARGEYVNFVDGDDYIAPDAIEKLYRKACLTNADVVCADYYRVGPGYCIPKTGRWEREAIDGDTLLKYHLTNRIEGYLCVNLYRRELFRDVIYPKWVGMLEDKIINVQIAANFPAVVVHLAEPLYYYVRRADSLSNGYAPLEYTIGVVDQIEQFLRNRGIYERYAPWMMLYRLISYYHHINSTSRKSIAREPYVIELQKQTKAPQMRKLMREYMPWNQRAIIRLHRNDSTVWMGKVLTTIYRIGKSIKKRWPGSRK